MTVEALRLSPDNIGAAAELCGSLLEWSQDHKAFIFELRTSPGRKVLCLPGMWLVKTDKTWVAMTNRNFQIKYERANHKGERVPPYTAPTDVEAGWPAYDH